MERGDTDLYVRRGALPGPYVYDCRPLREGNEEICTFMPPFLTAGHWYLMLRGHKAYDGVTAQEPESDSLPSADAVAEAASLAEYRELRERLREDDDVVDSTRRVLAESKCVAVLWFDGLFGSGEGDLASARRTSGGMDLAARAGESHGPELDAGVRLRYDLSNLEPRVNVFIGRGDGEDAVHDRERQGAE